jgi:hypothetical protein
VAAAAFVWAHVCLARPLAQHSLWKLSGYMLSDLKQPLHLQGALHLAVGAMAQAHLAVRDKYKSVAFDGVAHVAPGQLHSLALLCGC